MIRFDTRDTKPKLRKIVILSAAAAAVLLVMHISGVAAFIPFSTVLIVYLALCLVFLLEALKGQLEYNPYSYNTIYYSGFSVLLGFLLAAQTVTMISVISDGTADVYYVHTALGMILDSTKIYMVLNFPLILIFAVWLCASNIELIRHEGRRLSNLLGILLSFLLVAGDLVLFFTDFYASGSQLEVMIHDLLVNLYAAVYLYFECMMIGTIIANLIVIRHEPQKNKDCIIVLGCGLREDGTPTPLLAGRIERALKFYQEQLKETGKAPVFITSGGQGADEVIAESTSMKNYLMAKGVPAESILEENRSTDTYENMLFSRQIIEQYKPDAKVIFSTTNYHVFRSGIWARRVKMRATGIGAETKWYFWPNATVREFVGLLTEHRVKQALILGTMIVLYIAVTAAGYLIF